MSNESQEPKRLEDEARVWLIWTGESGHVVVDPITKDITPLVAGGRYQMPESVADYRLTREAHLWKRPDSPRAKTSIAAAKE